MAKQKVQWNDSANLKEILILPTYKKNGKTNFVENLQNKAVLKVQKAIKTAS